MSNTRTRKTFPSNMRKGLRHYIKRVFQPKRPLCSQAREGPPALSQPAAAPRQPGPGAGSGPAGPGGGGSLGSRSCSRGRGIFHPRRPPPPPRAGTCTPLLRFGEKDSRGRLRIVFHAPLAVLGWPSICLVRGGGTAGLFFSARRAPTSVQGAPRGRPVRVRRAAELSGRSARTPAAKKGRSHRRCGETDCFPHLI